MILKSLLFSLVGEKFNLRNSNYLLESRVEEYIASIL